MKKAIKIQYMAPQRLQIPYFTTDQKKETEIQKFHALFIELPKRPEKQK